MKTRDADDRTAVDDCAPNEAEGIPNQVTRCAGKRAMPDVIAIVGPTASGKSEVAEELAVRLLTSVVSADSMQVYKHMDIGTAKVPVERRRAPLLCVDLVEPSQTFSVAEYARCAHSAIDEIVDRQGRIAIVCGGTGLYMRAALEDMSFPEGDQTDNPVREHYQELAKAIGPDQLHERLRTVDPDSASLIHPNNVRRVIRALELHEQGLSYARNHETLHDYVNRRPTLIVGLDMPRELLYERIDRRVDHMVSSGLVEEVESLMEQGLGETLTSRQAIGYKEIIEALRQEGDARSASEPSESALGRAIDLIKTRSRRYAKRQLTWFRRDPRVQWLPYDGSSPASLADEILDIATEHDAALVLGDAGQAQEE
jgi:tRNA dimethylallyltransferase